jgi:hypothetical protein
MNHSRRAANVTCRGAPVERRVRQHSPSTNGTLTLASLEFDLDEGELIAVDVDDVVGHTGEARV